LERNGLTRHEGIAFINKRGLCGVDVDPPYPAVHNMPTLKQTPRRVL
jgi:hypothetical protein